MGNWIESIKLLLEKRRVLGVSRSQNKKNESQAMLGACRDPA
jgi:hypothetical protein